MAAAMDINDDDDPIVSEVELVLTGSQSSDIKVVVAPTRPATFDHGSGANERISKVEYKPVANQFTITCDLTIHRDWRDDHALGHGVMGNKKLVLRSEPMQTQCVYVIAVASEGRVHLTPVNDFSLLKPSLGFVDEKRAAEAAAAAATARTETKRVILGDEPTRPDVAMRQHVLVERRESDIARHKRESSFSFMQGRIDAEVAVPLKWIPQGQNGDFKRARLLAKPLAAGVFPASNSFIMPVREYLTPLTPAVVARPESARASVFSTDDLLAMPIRERLVAYFTRYHVTSHDDLERLGSASERSALLAAVTETAQLVRGNWVAKSSLPGVVQSLALVPVRDYILWLFTQQQSVTPAEVKQATGARMSDIKDLLRSLTSTVRVDEGYRFVKPDGDVLRFKAQADAQARKWTAMHPDIMARLGKK